MSKVVILTENEVKKAATAKEFLQKSSDNAHILIDKAIILKALVNDIISNEELDREKITNMAEEMIRLSSEVRGNADLVLKTLSEVGE